MNWDAIGAIGEILGASAVLLTLVYLGRQIKQTSQEIRSSNFHAITDSFNAINITIAENADLARVYRSGNESFSSLSEDEKTRYHFFMHAAFRVMDVLYYQSHRGTGDTTLWQAEKATIEDLLAPVGAREWWKTRSFNFSKEFVDYIDMRVMPKFETSV